MFFRRIDDSHRFKPLLAEIEEAPLNPLGPLVFWLVLAVFFLALAWAFFGRVDVVVSARGKFVPVGEVKVVQSLATGVVREITVEVGDYVGRGEVLIEIDPSDTEPELDAKREELQQCRLDMARLRALLSGGEFDPADMASVSTVRLREAMEQFQAARSSLDRKLKAKEAGIRAVREQLAAAGSELEHARFRLAASRERLERLQGVRDIISRDEWQDAGEAFRKALAARDTAGHRVGELRASLARLRRERDFIAYEQKDRWLGELNELSGKAKKLEAAIRMAAFHNARQRLKSPVNGYVSRLGIHTSGAVVTPAEKLVEVVPADSRLMVRALLANRDAGFVSAGMKAGIKVDAFDFQKYGVIDGVVEKVGRDSIEDKRMGLVYELAVTPEKDEMLVDGRPRKISAGMGATVEVRVGRRRLIELFVYPAIKYFREGVGVR